jgi:chromosome segregation ATPase
LKDESAARQTAEEGLKTVQTALDDAMVQIDKLGGDLTAKETELATEKAAGEQAGKDLKAAQSALDEKTQALSDAEATIAEKDKALKQAEELKASLTDQVMDLVTAWESNMKGFSDEIKTVLEQKLAERKAQREAQQGVDTPEGQTLDEMEVWLTDLYNRICENISVDPAG